MKSPLKNDAFFNELTEIIVFGKKDIELSINRTITMYTGKLETE